MVIHAGAISVTSPRCQRESEVESRSGPGTAAIAEARRRQSGVAASGPRGGLVSRERQPPRRAFSRRIFLGASAGLLVTGAASD